MRRFYAPTPQPQNFWFALAASGTSFPFWSFRWISHSALIKAANAVQVPFPNYGVCHGVAAEAVMRSLSGENTSESMNKCFSQVDLLSHDELKKSDSAMTFLNSIAIHHQPYVAPVGVREKVSGGANRQDLLLSSQMMGYENLVCPVSFSDVYTVAELTELFSQLAAGCKAAGAPVGFMLSDGGHTVSAFYSIVDDNWRYVDANKLPVKTYVGAEEIAVAVGQGLFAKKDSAILNTNVYCWKEDGEKVVEVLSVREPEVTRSKAEALTIRGVNWLHVAASFGDLALVKQLIEVVSSVNASNSTDGRTALHAAARNGFDDIVEVLMRAGADPSREDKQGNTPGNLARRYGFVGTVDLIDRVHEDLEMAKYRAENKPR